MPSKFLGVPLKIAGRRPAIFQKTLLFMNPPWDVTYGCPSRCKQRSLLIYVRMILKFQASFSSFNDRVFTFKSESHEFEPHRGRELFQKIKAFFLLIEEQLSMLKFFRLCMMVTFPNVSSYIRGSMGKFSHTSSDVRGGVGKAKDPPPLLKYKLKRMNSQKSRKINK